MATSSSTQTNLINPKQIVETSTLELDDEDLIIASNENQISLLCRIVTDKNIKLNIFHSVMTTAWGVGFSVRDGPSGLLQVNFNDEFEMFRVLNGAPWQYKKYLVLLRPWEIDYTYKPSDFQFVPFWIQLRGIPESYVTKHLGLKTGKSIGEVLACDIYNVKDGKIAKVRISLDIFQSLPRGIMLQKGTDTKFMIDYQYESLGIFCFYCGIIGHEKNGCRQLFQDTKSNAVHECLWDDSLRAIEVGIKNYELSNPHPIIRPTMKLSTSAGLQKVTTILQDKLPGTNVGSSSKKPYVVPIDLGGKRERNDNQESASAIPETMVYIGPVSKKKTADK